MRKQETEVLKRMFEEKIVNAKVQIEINHVNEEVVEVREAMINYEKGMIRGLERGLSMIKDLKEIMEDERMKRLAK